jgi:FkbM family methyltransferase
MTNQIQTSRQSAGATLAVTHARLMGYLHGQGFIPNYENIIEDTYRKLIPAGGTVFDVGAHTGRHTVVFADLVGPEGCVHAFEPLPDAFAALQKRRLGVNIHLHALAIAEHCGESDFVFAKGAPEESGLRQRQYNRPERVEPKTIKVKTCPLDDFMEKVSFVTFIKIDVEGGEIGCLRSGRGLIMRHRPWITVEYGRPAYSAYGHELRTLFDEAASLNYVLGDLFGAVCEDLKTWEKICDRAYWDWYMIPKERVGEWMTRLNSVGE